MEESVGLSLSVQTGQTAVPVFAFGTSTSWGGAVGGAGTGFNKDGVTEFNAWLDVTTVRQRFITDAKGDVHQEKADAFDLAVKSDPLYQSLQLYFINGGGHCYVAPVDKLAELVPALDDVTLLVQAGTGQADFLKAAMDKKLCQTGNPYFALFDGPNDAPLTDKAGVDTAAKTYPDTPYGAVYYPWLTVSEGIIAVPPSGAVAGVYARVDRERGVWKAPANVEIIGAEPRFTVTDEVDGYCNVPASGGKSINVIRRFRGTGPLIWGARTLSSKTPAWRYVPVRRLFCAAEKDIKTAMSMALFEPNNAPTWERVRGAIESYLHGLWKEGALQGEIPEQAYFVQVGLGTTMTQDDIDNGKMVVKVGLAAVRPAEFIVLQLSQNVVTG
ncbi:phage tail sheath family protein [Serratia ureilytica]|uniref:phage tail sheath family protein n=1 Tax=Serratia ureilytica TaxID=300181 RepID=UPI003F9A0AA0